MTRYPNMASEQQRLRSFSTWTTQSDVCTPKALAEAGFFHSPDLDGADDRCLCYSCGLSLIKWEPDDVPWVEHAKHAKGCEHVLRFMADIVASKKDSSTTSSSATAEEGRREAVRVASERAAPNLSCASKERAEFVAAVFDLC